MSRTGKKIIKFDAAAVQIKFSNNIFNCKGKHGNIEVALPEGIKLNIKDNTIQLEPTEMHENHAKTILRNNRRQLQSSWGTARQIIFNAIKGVSESFQKTLILEGVGFRASVAGKKLTLAVGYSHPVEYILPESVMAKVDNNTKITLNSYNKQELGKIAAEIRKIRKPEPYKGKGIKFEGEIIKRKAGKTGKK